MSVNINDLRGNVRIEIVGKKVLIELSGVRTSNLDGVCLQLVADDGIVRTGNYLPIAIANDAENEPVFVLEPGREDLTEQEEVVVATALDDYLHGVKNRFAAAANGGADLTGTKQLLASIRRKVTGGRL